MLFFGCRSSRADFFFAEEWLPLENEGFLQLFTAFSRDQEHKVYVQHSIEREGLEVWQWMRDKQAHVFIAGCVHVFIAGYVLHVHVHSRVRTCVHSKVRTCVHSKVCTCVRYRVCS